MGDHGRDTEDVSSQTIAFPLSFVRSVWLQAGCIFAIATTEWTLAQKWNCSLFASWDQLRIEVT